MRVPQVLRDEPEPWSRHKLAVAHGPAPRRYEQEQRSPSFVPLRDLCLIGYHTLMRPENNRQLDWEEITLDPVAKCTFKLNQPKNVNKGIKARGPIARELFDYLMSIRPPNASGPIHPNPKQAGPTSTSASSGNACSLSPPKSSGTN